MSYNLPVHVLPSPEYPALQAHAYEPKVLVHIALTSQLWVLAEHSSISAYEHIVKVVVRILKVVV